MYTYYFKNAWLDTALNSTENLLIKNYIDSFYIIGDETITMPLNTFVNDLNNYCNYQQLNIKFSHKKIENYIKNSDKNLSIKQQNTNNKQREIAGLYHKYSNQIQNTIEKVKTINLKPEDEGLMDNIQNLLNNYKYQDVTNILAKIVGKYYSNSQNN